jgi:hypothetical protein
VYRQRSPARNIRPFEYEGAATGLKPVRESDEVAFIDCAQSLGHRTPNDFVLQGWHAERSPTSIRFRDENAAHRNGRQRPVSSASSDER